MAFVVGEKNGTILCHVVDEAGPTDEDIRLLGESMPSLLSLNRTSCGMCYGTEARPDAPSNVAMCGDCTP